MSRVLVSSCAACVCDLATRHGIDADELLEVWAERAATREYLAQFRRGTAELFAIGDVERMYQIGLHCPETLARWMAGGQRVRPVSAVGLRHVRSER